jgi:hypothetical protein
VHGTFLYDFDLAGSITWLSVDDQGSLWAPEAFGGTRIEQWRVSDGEIDRHGRADLPIRGAHRHRGVTASPTSRRIRLAARSSERSSGLPSAITNAAFPIARNVSHPNEVAA